MQNFSGASGGGGSMSGAAIKQNYEAQPDTNVFTDAEKAKLAAANGFSSANPTASRIAISNDEKIEHVRALMHIHNGGDVTNGLLVQGDWEGATNADYQNNDVILVETRNDILSDSTNYSWAISASNAYHKIPANVRDDGFRVGVLGWATSVANGDYVHEGYLEAQTGVWGRAGFQGPGSGDNAEIGTATGVYGEVLSESGAKINLGVAGSFKASAISGEIENAYGVFSVAQNGTKNNYSFYGAAGKFFNVDTVCIGSEYSDIDAPLVMRTPTNCLEFGFPDAGYGSALGSTKLSGFPFISFCSSYYGEGDTFSTNGKTGSVILSDLNGGLIFAAVENSNQENQPFIEKMRLRADGKLECQAGIITKNNIAPTSANAEGVQGEIRSDDNYLYLCIADNVWKRTALESW